MTIWVVDLKLEIWNLYGNQNRPKRPKVVIIVGYKFGRQFKFLVMLSPSSQVDIYSNSCFNNLISLTSFVQRVMEHFIKIYKKKKGKDLRKDNRAVQKLRREVEKAKRALSNSHQVKIEVESLYDGEDFTETLTRAKFEELNMDLFRSTMKPVQKVMEDADMQKKDVDEIVLVGGSTRIPKVNYQITWMETYQNLCTRFTFFCNFFILGSTIGQRVFQWKGTFQRH